MWSLRKFDKEKTLLAFEYGLTIARVAQEQGIEMTPELVQKAEAMIENEFRTQSASFLATHMEINILSVFELDVSK